MRMMLLSVPLIFAIAVLAGSPGTIEPDTSTVHCFSMPAI